MTGNSRRKISKEQLLSRLHQGFCYASGLARDTEMVPALKAYYEFLLLMLGYDVGRESEFDPTEDEAAELLRVARKTLRQWRWRRTGPPAVRVGTRACRYRLTDLLSYVANLEVYVGEGRPRDT